MNQLVNDLKNLRFIRKAFVNTIAKLSDEQLNTIPDGFKNNIIWNLAHCICSTQSMCYGPSGNEIGIAKDLLAKYKNGTQPESPVSSEEINYWKELAKSSIAKMEDDLNNNIFSNYHAWDLSKNYKVESVEDALSFSYFHEGIHFGYAMAMKKLI
jgi:hypothetical protein